MSEPEHTPKPNGNGSQVHLRVSRNTARWLLIIGVVLAVIFSFCAAFYTLTATTDKVDENSEDIAHFKRAFRADKVCSLSNQGKACVDLFDRIERNITEAQRRELACGTLEELDIPEADEWRRKADCP